MHMCLRQFMRILFFNGFHGACPSLISMLACPKKKKNLGRSLDVSLSSENSFLTKLWLVISAISYI